MWRKRSSYEEMQIRSTMVRLLDLEAMTQLLKIRVLDPLGKWLFSRELDRRDS